MEKCLRHRNTVLLVEDHPTNMKLMEDLLEASGYQVVKASSGFGALKLAYQSQPDLILLDIQLPDISGMEVARRLKTDEPTRGIPIVAVTAFAMVGDKEKFLESGCDAYIPKPIDINRVIETVTNFLPCTIYQGLAGRIRDEYTSVLG